MPEVIFTGAAGRIEGRYHPARQKNAPIGIVLHPHPQFGGTMNHQIIYQLYYAFVHRNFSVLRFNFRGVGRSQAHSTMARESFPMPLRHLIGRSQSIRRLAAAGSPVSLSEPGSACNC